MTHKRATAAKRGFTLIELMIVVAIIGILAAIAIPKFADLLRKSNEGATKGNLGSLRSAVTIYYSDMEGQYPTANLSSSLTNGGKYLERVPQGRQPPYHAGSAAVADYGAALEAGGWSYENAVVSAQGTIVVNCSHTDTRNQTWSGY